MRVLRRSLAPFVIGSLAAAAAGQDHAALHAVRTGAARFDLEAKPELEVMRARTGHLLVRPALNGREAGWFIFDTGAGICVISTPLAAPFELEPAGDLATSGVGGDTTTQALRAELLELGPMRLADVPLMSTDLSFLGAHLGVQVAGVIGYGVLSRCVVELDLEAPRIALYDASTYELAQGAWTPLTFDELIPTVSATFEDHPGRFHLDIGANVALTLQEPTVRRLRLLDGRELADAKLGGVGGTVAAKRGRVAWFELAGVRLENVETSFVTEAKGVHGSDRIDGSVGTALLEHFQLTLDYAGQRASFRPRAPASAAK